MSQIRTFFVIELKRIFKSKKNISLLVVAALFTLSVVGVALYRYQKKLDDTSRFITLAATNHEASIKDYTLYSLLGVKVFVSSDIPTYMLNRKTIPIDMTARYDSVAGLEIFFNAKGRNIFVDDSSSPFSLSFILSIIGPLLALFYGRDTFRRLDFSRFITCSSKRFPLYAAKISARLLLIFLLLVALLLLPLLMILIFGFTLSSGIIISFSGILLSSFLELSIFLLVGAIMGGTNLEKYSIPLIFAAWFTFVYLIPGFIKTVVSIRAEGITSSYKVEYDQLKVAIDYERELEKEHGEFNRENIETERQLVERYYKKDFKKIELLEENLKSEISENIRLFQRLSLLTPTTFNNLTSSEVSSMGFENYLRLYDYLQKSKRKFLRFYIDRTMYNDPRIMVSFVQNGENLFFVKSRLPKHFALGVMIQLGYLIALFFGAYAVIRKKLFNIDEKVLEEKATPECNIERNELNIWLVGDEHFGHLLFNVFSGKTPTIKNNRLPGTITLDSSNLLAQDSPVDFLYLPHPGAFPPDLRAKDLIRLYARQKEVSIDWTTLIPEKLRPLLDLTMGELKPAQQVEVMLTLLHMKPYDVYLLDNVTTGLPLGCALRLKDAMEKLAAAGAAVIYLTTDNLLEPVEIEDDQWFIDGKSWFYFVEVHRRKLMAKSEKNARKVSQS